MKIILAAAILAGATSTASAQPANWWLFDTQRQQCVLSTVAARETGKEFIDPAAATAFARKVGLLQSVQNYREPDGSGFVIITIKAPAGRVVNVKYFTAEAACEMAATADRIMH